MKKYLYILLILIFAFQIQSSTNAQKYEKNGIFLNENLFEKNLTTEDLNPKLTSLYGRKASGTLDIEISDESDEFQVYFHVPISYREQVPFLFQIECPHLIDYRFVYLDSINMVVVADLENVSQTTINWTAFVLIKGKSYVDLPNYVSMDELNNLPDSVKDFLKGTDCVQTFDPFIQELAEIVRDSTDNIIQLSDNINYVCDTLGYAMSHIPWSLDAFYSLHWGSSCTGHAHAGAALFRANGVPARVLLNIPTWYNNYFDQHWMIDYYVPNYGWVGMETSLGQNPFAPQNQIITFACNSWDEFPIYYMYGIECQWHSSVLENGNGGVDWGAAHLGENTSSLTSITVEQRDSAFNIVKNVNSYFTKLKGVKLNMEHQQYFDIGHEKHTEALESLFESNYMEFMQKMNEALTFYKKIPINPMQTIFFDDCENGNTGWTFEGDDNKWEIGIPEVGPDTCWSGVSCWGTDLDSVYANNVSYSLISPAVSLYDLSCAYLSFAIYCDVEDFRRVVYDKTWLEIILDDSVTLSFSSEMGGINDEDTIPQIGGWNKIGLDLTKYVGHTIKIKFNFNSNEYLNFSGTYIDDIIISGRMFEPIKVSSTKYSRHNLFLGQNIPNPFKDQTKIEFVLDAPGKIELSLFNINGVKLKTILNEHKSKGKHSIVVGTHDIPAGVYYYSIKANNKNIVKKCVKM